MLRSFLVFACKLISILISKHTKSCNFEHTKYEYADHELNTREREDEDLNIIIV
jgi:hypothetical protein